MNIRDWPMNRIMQLPECCFGRRWLISVLPSATAPATGWDISEIPFPDKCVIWGFWAWFDRYGPQVDYIRLALGDQLPTTTAMMDALEPLFPGFGLQGAGPRAIPLTTYAIIHLTRLKMPVWAQGRRLVGEVQTTGTGEGAAQIVVVVSSIPTEVPDCLLSAHP